MKHEYNSNANHSTRSTVPFSRASIAIFEKKNQKSNFHFKIKILRVFSEFLIPEKLFLRSRGRGYNF